MKIFVIDDELAVLSYMAACLEEMGHRAHTYASPRMALENVSADVDIVITDVGMPEMNGFAVATEVARKLGKTPPRTLLISGNPHKESMERAAPSTVLGLLAKPLIPSELQRVLRFIGQTRNRCPGRMAPLCAHSGSHGLAVAGNSKCGDVRCESREYGLCPHYDTICGRHVQDWVAMTAGGAGWDRM